MLFHFRTDGLLTNLPPIRRGWMFVDFFFVLSGFVLAHAYFGRIGREIGRWRFLALRLGRIYPLHAAVLAAMLAMELLLAAAPGLSGRAAFGPGRSVGELLLSLLFLNASGLVDRLVWNGPSWSIAAEFWAYVMFALLALIRRTWPFALVAVASGISLLVLHPDLYEASFDFGTLRCLFGFSLGVATWRLRGMAAERPGFALASAAELLFVLAILGFTTVMWGGPGTLLAPILFAGAVTVFADDAGLVSRFLASRPFVAVGTISYALYMVHPFVQSRLMEGIAWLGLARTGTPDRVAAGAWADAITVAMIGLVIGAAALAYRWIEKPARDWSRRKLRAPAAEREAPTF